MGNYKEITFDISDKLLGNYQDLLGNYQGITMELVANAMNLLLEITRNLLGNYQDNIRELLWI